MHDLAEEVFDIRVEHLPVVVHCLGHQSDALHRLTARTEPVRARKENLFVDGLQKQSQRALDHAVQHVGYPEGPLPSIRFRDVNPTNRARLDADEGRVTFLEPALVADSTR